MPRPRPISTKISKGLDQIADDPNALLRGNALSPDQGIAEHRERDRGKKYGNDDQHHFAGLGPEIGGDLEPDQADRATTGRPAEQQQAERCRDQQTSRQHPIRARMLTLGGVFGDVLDVDVGDAEGGNAEVADQHKRGRPDTVGLESDMREDERRNQKPRRKIAELRQHLDADVAR
jgi:hypothetical protein